MGVCGREGKGVGGDLCMNDIGAKCSVYIRVCVCSSMANIFDTTHNIFIIMIIGSKRVSSPEMAQPILFDGPKQNRDCTQSAIICHLIANGIWF